MESKQALFRNTLSLYAHSTVIDNFSIKTQVTHAGPGEGTKLHARKNFCVFYPIELKLCTMIEILIPNNRIVFVF